MTAFEFECPSCEKPNTARIGDNGTWMCAWWKCGLDYADVLGCPVSVLLEDAPRLLEPYTTSSSRRRGATDPLPSPMRVRFWQEALEGSPGAAYLESRGIALWTAQEAGVGWDGRKLWFPMYNQSGELVAAKYRAPRDGAQMMALRGGREWPLYPTPGITASTFLLVAGELDALRAQRSGITALSVTLGAGTWRDEWTKELRFNNRRVVVCFDNGEEKQALNTVARLKEGGIKARRLSLSYLGLTDPKADLSDYLNGGGSVKKLREAMKP